MWRASRAAAAALVVGVIAATVASGGPTYAATTTPTQAELQCSGDQFVPTPTDAADAADLMAGHLRIPTFETYELPQDIDWSADPFQNTTWTFHFHSLHWADPLRRVGMAEHDQAMLDRYVEIVRDWVADNPRQGAPSAYSWYDMAVGFRAVELVCLSTALDAQPAWLTDAIRTHAEALGDEAEYAGRGNHALYQNLGLLALGCAFDDASWRSLAVDRASALLALAVDEEGVTDEGSTLYQGLNHVWYTELRSRLDACGLHDLPMMSRIDKMPEMLGYATQPDGNLVAFGDTSALQRSTPFGGTIAQYAVTQGRLGPRPDRTFAVFRRGYAFSRSGWFDTQTAAQQSLASIRFGGPLATEVHGHQDAGALGYYADGTQILWQPGLWGGGGGPSRAYVRSISAHNAVEVPGLPYDRTASTSLVAAAGGAAADLVTVSTGALTGATWQRSMVHAKQAELMVVDDKVTQAERRTVLQRWHLGADRRVVATGCSRIDTNGRGTNTTILWVGGCPRLSVAYGQLTPMLGWRSLHPNELVPSPTVTARTSGTAVRMTALVVPRPSGVAASDVEVVGSRLTPTGGWVDVRLGDRVHRVSFTESGSQAGATVQRAASPSRTTALVRSQRRSTPSTVRVSVVASTGQVPRGSVVLSVGGRTVHATLTRGGALLSVPRLAPGSYRARATYLGSRYVAPSRARLRLVVAGPGG